jgi:hypothetical protein
MKKETLYGTSFVLIIALTLIIMGRLFSTAKARPNPIINSKTLTAGRAIASWPSGIPAGETRPVIVFLPGWGGNGAVNASVTAQNTNLANQGYVTLAIGFDSSSTWNSDIQVKTLQGLNKLCTDAAIPANCDAIVLDGSSYGGAQNYWVIEYLHNHGYDGGPGSSGNAIGFISEDAGYGAPGILTNPSTGAYTRTGLADTSSYSVAMIENSGDITFPINECTWGNCGIKVLSNAHLARGDTNVFSICPPGGGHGTRGYANWNTWVISAIKTIIHIENGIPAFTGYTNPVLTVSNSCVTSSSNEPDLIITNVTVNPAMPQTNQTFEVSITIKNQGGAGGASIIYRDVYIDRDPAVDADPFTGCTSSGEFFRSDSYTSLDAGMSDTKTVTVTGGLPPGNHQIWVYVDSRCLVDESGESNNNP